MKLADVSVLFEPKHPSRLNISSKNMLKRKFPEAKQLESSTQERLFGTGVRVYRHSSS